ncbi:hypothetical protein [Sinomonas sp. P10A9]|uniref:Helix-turn-helix protein n=1 Tax=Sinomonas puerhi TaxID=3238584 RepID=A0AB39L5N0_9MICC
MITMDRALDQLHHAALQRQARSRVDAIDELRAAKQVADRGLPQRDIAELLATSQARVHRMLKALERSNHNVPVTPEEIILRACAYDTSRDGLVQELTRFDYTFGEEAPYPLEGRISGTWDEVVKALASGMISQKEFDQVRAAIGR